jgi:hypothetical protein
VLDGASPIEPTGDVFTASPNAMEMTSRAGEGTLAQAAQPGGQSIPLLWSDGWYLLDNGGGLEKCEDIQHECLLQPVHAQPMPEGGAADSGAAPLAVVAAKVDLNSSVPPRVPLRGSEGPLSSSAPPSDERHTSGMCIAMQTADGHSDLPAGIK